MHCCSCNQPVRDHSTVSADHLPGVAAGFTSRSASLVICETCYTDPLTRVRFWQRVRSLRQTATEPQAYA